MFAAHKGAVVNELADTGLKPALYWCGQPLVAIGCIRYHASDLGAYDEVIVAVPAVPAADTAFAVSNWLNLLAPPHRKRVGQYILDIPVTSEFSRVAGNELWGYPKIVAPITHEFQQRSIHSTVFDPASGNRVVRVAGSFGKGLPAVPLSLLTYSFRKGKLLRTEVVVEGHTRLHIKPAIRLLAGDAANPMAARLHRLGLHNASALLLLRMPLFRAVFLEGKEVGGN